MYEIFLSIIFSLSLTYLPISQNLQLILIILYIILILPSLYTYLKGPPFVPSSDTTIQNAIKLSKPTKQDIVYDLGCGDGKFLIAIAPHCKKAIGYELSFLTFLAAKFKTRKFKNIEVRFQNLWKANLKDADIVFCFLLIRLMPEVQSRIWPQLKPNTRLISNTFKLKSQKPTQTIENVHLYTKE